MPIVIDIKAKLHDSDWQELRPLFWEARIQLNNQIEQSSVQPIQLTAQQTAALGALGESIMETLGPL